MPSHNHTDSVPPHYLKPLAAVKVPRKVIAFHAASRTTEIREGKEHTLRCWSLMGAWRGNGSSDPQVIAANHGTDVDDFIDCLEPALDRSGTTYAYTFNCGYSATLLQIPTTLVKRGWILAKFNITSENVWFKLHKGKKTLVIADIQTIIPEQMPKLADYVGITLETAPNAATATDEDWQAYCWNHVQIVLLNALICMDYVQKHDLGSWASTGSAIGWNVFRHKFLTHDILITSDRAARDFERMAIRGGRREVFQTAEWESGYFVDIDIRSAYPTIAREFDLPCKRGSRFASVPISWHDSRPKDQGIIARCTVRTNAPLAPAQFGTTTFYPTGEFTTILASPEIDLLRQSGASVEIGMGYRYKLAPIMQKWGEFACGSSGAMADDVPESVRRMVKHWSRATIGRWTMRYMREDPDWRATPDAPPVSKIGYLTFRDEDKFWRDGLQFVKPGAIPTRDVEGFLINIDGTPRAFFRDEEPRDAFPAIAAWVESICRVILVKLMASQQAGRVMQCDTDGYLVRLTDRDILNVNHASFFAKPDVDAIFTNGCDVPLPKPPEHFTISIKGRYTSVYIRGAQQLRLDNQRRMAGIPHNARELAPDLLEAEVYPTYVEQMRHGRRGVFISHDVTFTTKTTIAAGWRERSGRVTPVEMRVKDGVNIILQPKWSMLTTPGRKLAQHQHPILEAILHG